MVRRLKHLFQGIDHATGKAKSYGNVNSFKIQKDPINLTSDELSSDIGQI